MDTLELFNELLKKSDSEIEFVLLKLLLANKIDFIQISQSYVQSLLYKDAVKEAKLTEAYSCIIESLYDGSPEEEWVKDTIQRRLYLLNTSSRYNMKSLNEKYNYNEEKGKSLNHEKDTIESLTKRL